MFKKIFSLFIAVSISMCILSTCASKPTGVTDTDIIRANRDAEYLESTIKRYEAAIDSTVRELEDLRARAESMDATIDGVIELFGQYQRLVEQLIYNYNKLREQAENTTQSTNHPINFNYRKNHNSYYWCSINVERRVCTTMVRHNIIEGEYVRKRKYYYNRRQEATC